MAQTAQENIHNTEKTLKRVLPHNEEAERAILSALLLNDEEAQQVIELIFPEDFYTQAHKIIFECMIFLTEQYKRIDLITLKNELEKRKVLSTIGGLEYLVSLQEDIPSMGLIKQHAHIVREKAILRNLISSATNIITSCYAQNEKTIDSVLDDAEKTIFQISHKRTQESFVQLNIWLKKTFQHLSDIKSYSKGVTGIPSGFANLDKITSGFQKGDLIVLAARPSMGKTALALRFAAQASQEGYALGFFSLEMAAEQLTLRLLSSESYIPHYHIRNATISSEEWLELTHVAAQLGKRKFFIDDTPLVSIMELRAKARKLKATHNISMLIVDYLQLLHSTKRHENRHQEVSEISRSLKALAKELEIPVIALSQLSRAVDSRMDKRPMLSDLRESGAIEQDGDLIMFLYRDVVYHQDTENPSLGELIIGKQRNGPTGTVYLDFSREITRFDQSEHEGLGM